MCPDQTSQAVSDIPMKQESWELLLGPICTGGWRLWWWATRLQLIITWLITLATSGWQPYACIHNQSKNLTINLINGAVVYVVSARKREYGACDCICSSVHSLHYSMRFMSETLTTKPEAQ